MYFMSNNAPANWTYQVANVPEAFRKYSGLEFTFEKRMANGWQMGGSINYSKTWGNIGGSYNDIHATTTIADNANWFVNWGGRTGEDRPLVLKLFGSFNIPYGFLVSFYYQGASGTPWARGVTVQAPTGWAEANNVVQDSYYVALETNGARRYYTWHNVDFRIEKEFKFGDTGRLGVFADVFNLLGQTYINVNENPGGTWIPDDNNSSTRDVHHRRDLQADHQRFPVDPDGPRLRPLQFLKGPGYSGTGFGDRAKDLSPLFLFRRHLFSLGQLDEPGFRT